MFSSVEVPSRTWFFREQVTRPPSHCTCESSRRLRTYKGTVTAKHHQRGQISDSEAPSWPSLLLLLKKHLWGIIKNGKQISGNLLHFFSTHTPMSTLTDSFEQIDYSLFKNRSRSFTHSSVKWATTDRPLSPVLIGSGLFPGLTHLIMRAYITSSYV